MWSKTKQRLENSICDSFRGRVSYFCTEYRKTHDSVGRYVILVDGKEVFNICTSTYHITLYRKKLELDNDTNHENKYKSK